MRKIYSLQGLFQSVSSLTEKIDPFAVSLLWLAKSGPAAKYGVKWRPCWLHYNQFTLNPISKLLTFKWGQMFIDLEGCFGRSAGATPLSAVKGGKTSAMQSDIIARLQREQILYCRHRRSPPRAGEADFRSNRAALIARHKNSRQGPSESLDGPFGFLGLYNTIMN